MSLAPDGPHRAALLAAAVEFVRAAAKIPGVRGIGVLGSIVTARSDPKDLDLLITIAEDANLAVLARHARRLQGRAQQNHRGADIFLVDERGCYLERTCHWKNCRPGIRASCDALHCGRRPHLHDDLDTIPLEPSVLTAPPVTLWPEVIRRQTLPADVERMITELNTLSNTACSRQRGEGPRAAADA